MSVAKLKVSLYIYAKRKHNVLVKLVGDYETTIILERVYQMLVELYVNNRKPDSVSLISKHSLLQIWVPEANHKTLSAKGILSRS